MYRLLEGMTVVEGSAFIAGPSCGLHFAQMGARVIRFDAVGGGPDARRWPLGGNGQSLYWEGLNKGKRSIAIDLSRAEGRELAQRLATAGDGLFVTNFPAGSFLSYDALKPLRADLLCLRLMGWSDGAPAVDYTINASAGLPITTGFADDPRPVNHVLPAWDLLAGAYGAFALLAAERERGTTGDGREIRLALSDLAAATLGNLGQVAEVQLSGQDRPRSGNNLYGAFGRDFVTRDGARIMLVAITPRQWSGVISALDLADQIAKLEAELGADFAADEGARFLHRDRLDPLVVAAVERLSLAELRSLLDRSGVTWSVYRSLADAISHEPRMFGSGSVFASARHAGGQSYPTPGAAVRLTGEDRDAPAGAPRIGEHSEEVLADLLGLDGGEIARLFDRGLVA